MGRKFYNGYRQGLWTIIDYPEKSKKALMRCDCGYEAWSFLSNLSSHKSQGCRSCMFKTPQHKTYLLVLRTASRRSLKWDLSEKEWVDLAIKNCYYCDSPPNNMIANYGFKYNGLDRIDSSLGYSLTNVVTCCKLCNRAKSDMPQQEFYDWIKRAYGKIISK
jgi:hypothetical protein